MQTECGALPVKRRSLIVVPRDAGFVAKDTQRGTYCKIGAREQFLLEQLDGTQERSGILAAYVDKFSESFEDEDLDAFFEIAGKHGLTETAAEAAIAPTQIRRATPGGNSLLAWRHSLADPDRFYTWVEPKLRWLWTWQFLAVSACFIAWAMLMLTINREQFVSNFHDLQWHTLAVAVIAILAVTAFHESAHGLTCKHFGGDVHEVGFLLLYFMPSFFCNVSDAWLMDNKRHRLAITFAGGYFELCLWALAAFVWRVTRLDTGINYAAWIIVSLCGVRILFNFIPFLKLDGYYLLSDACDVPNLRQSSLEYVASYLRWCLWGADRPAQQAKHFTLIGYGVTCWLFSIVFLILMFTTFGQLAFQHVGAWGVIPVVVIGLVASRSMFRGLASGEVRRMFATRKARARLWMAAGAIAVGGACFFPWEKRACGTFEMRPMTRVELRAPVAGFLKSISVAEGDSVKSDDLLGQLDIPELPSRIAEQRAAVRELKAKWQLLKMGARPEEIEDVRNRLARAESWHKLASSNLERNRQALTEEIARLDQRIFSAKAAWAQANETMRRAVDLRKQNVVSAQQFDETQKTQQIARSEVEQAIRERDGRTAIGLLDSEDELARRAKELAEANAALEMLLAGTRPEEIEASAATLARAEEELAYLESREARLDLRSRFDGKVVTPHLNEKIGQYFNEGDLICEIQESSILEAEIAIPEQEVKDIQPGQHVTLKARAMAYEIFDGQVERIAPMATAGTTGQTESTVTVYTRLDHPSPELRPGMTGYARVYCGSQPIGMIAVDYILRFIRTEYWW